MIKVTAAIISANGKVLIAKRKPPGRMPGLWEFPGGKLEQGETPEEGLERELQEELGVATRIGAYLGTNVHHYDFYTIALMAYRAAIVSGTLKLHEHDDMAWVSAEEIGGYAFAPADLPFVERIRGGEIGL